MSDFDSLLGSDLSLVCKFYLSHDKVLWAFFIKAFYFHKREGNSLEGGYKIRDYTVPFTWSHSILSYALPDIVYINHFLESVLFFQGLLYLVITWACRSLLLTRFSSLEMVGLCRLTSNTGSLLGRLVVCNAFICHSSSSHSLMKCEMGWRLWYLECKKMWTVEWKWDKNTSYHT